MPRKTIASLKKELAEANDYIEELEESLRIIVEVATGVDIVDDQEEEGKEEKGE